MSDTVFDTKEQHKLCVSWDPVDGSMWASYSENESGQELRHAGAKELWREAWPLPVAERLVSQRSCQSRGRSLRGM